jgi:cytoskeletal protein CcmA (bactofilin family)
MFERGKKDEPGQRQDEPEAAAPWGESARSASTPAREAAVIGRSIHIDGNLKGEEDLRIEGDVTGTIQLNNHSLTIGKDGKIKADVHAKVITVDGNMEGDLYGAERVSIRKTARVAGNIVAPRVSLEEGARFKGSIEMDPETVDAMLSKGQPAPKPPSTVTPSVVPKPTAFGKV